MHAHDNLTRERAWRALKDEAQRVRPLRMRDWFAPTAAGQARVAAMSAEVAGLYVDFSKHRADARVMAALTRLAEASAIEARRDAMLRGERVNASEDRAALHTALRLPDDAPPLVVDGTDLMPKLRARRASMAAFVTAVRDGRWRTASGATVSDVVHLGIGGSDFGPRLVCDALAPLPEAGPRVHFVANLDGDEMARVLSGLAPRRSLMVVASKTFTTRETLGNARSMQAWMRAAGLDDAEIARQSVALTARPDTAAAFGVPREQIFAYDDWVGGRFSLWSSVGLTIALRFGMPVFNALLAGAHALDRHFATAPLAANLPVTLALLGVWYRNFFDARSHCVVPYAHALQLLPAWLQQLDMESNGKSVRADGSALATPASPVIWGQPGTNGQHAFFEWMHQHGAASDEFAPLDLIAVAAPAPGLSATLATHQAGLLANCLAQAEALMIGRAGPDSLPSSADDATVLAAHRACPGNRPSTLILLPRLDPAALGALLALYEHKATVQGWLWDLNPFDQWGVELGKTLATPLEAALDGNTDLEAEASRHDASTAALMRKIAAWRGVNG